MTSKLQRQAYWKANSKLIKALLLIWAIFALVLSILLVSPLNDIASIGTLPLGFWIAQQGAIYVFVALIFVYATQMDKLDRRYGSNEKNGQDEIGSSDS